MGHAGIKAGVPAEFFGATFLCEPGRDRGDANAYLYALFTGKFGEKRRTNAPPWMGRSRKLKLGGRSLKCEAGDLSRGFRWLEDHGLSIRNMTEDHLDQLASELQADIEDGTVGAIQMSLLQCAQWTAWRGRRPELVVSWEPVAGHRDSVNILVVRKQRRQGPVDYIEPAQARALCQAVPDAAYRIAFRLMFGSGLRPSEPGAVKDSKMPHTARRSAIARDVFSVVGKGSVKRHPQVDSELIDDINEYRLLHRPARVKKYQAHRGEPPTHLLLNSKNGDPISYQGLYEAFVKACKIIGIKARMHWARHAFACNHLVDTVIGQITAARNAGLDVSLADVEPLLHAARVELMILLGHAALENSSIYLTQVNRAITHAFQHSFPQSGMNS
ncbi:site-specific integrase [Afipia sp. GAS231]|uniref:site-specific integrase n=1 Tax=Afipia sp. GAS231 TaxID=1882747 RepID=UPI0012FAB5FC|nr:site-specific integrase [Afipia sp. GAS231]